MISSLLVEAAIRSVFLALAVWIVLRAFSVRNVLAQKAAWGLVLAGALVMPLVLPMASHWNVLPANVRVALPADPETLLEELQARIQARTPPEQKQPADAAPAVEGAPLIEPEARPSRNETRGNRAVAPAEQKFSYLNSAEDVFPHSTVQTESAKPRAVAPPRAALSLSKMLLLPYLAVAGIFLVRLGCGLISALRLWQRAKPISGELPAVPGSSLDIRCSAEVSSPVTICSAIVLPEDYGTWDTEKLRVVLAHEGSHIRQKDFYLQLLAGIYAAVVWFSPLGWWLKGKLSDLAEAISDRAGLEEAADRTSYAQILLEFAAVPRPTLIGVAMARSGSVSRRIERLLNDLSFRQAFAGTRRALIAVLVVPVALFAATAMVRVQAAGQQAPEPPSAPAGGVISPTAPVAPAPPQRGVSEPEEISGEPAPVSPARLPAPPAHVGGPSAVKAPAAPASPSVHTITPLAPVAPPSVLTVVPISPAQARMMIALKNLTLAKNSLYMVAPVAPTMAIIAPHAGYGEGRGYGVGQSATESGSSSYGSNGKNSGYHYSYSSNGESYAVIRGSDTEHMTFSGNWIEGRREEIDKARKEAHGDFLWFTRDGKDYFVDDPSAVAQIESMYKPMEALGAQQEELGKQQEALGKQQEELGRQQEAVSVPTPDVSKQIAQIDEAMAKLKANQGKAMNEEQFAELQSKLGDLQGKLGAIQGEIGEKQGQFGEQMGKLGALQGELGAKQGRLGAEEGRLAQEADQKVKSIIDQSLKNGKAHPVQ